MNNKLTSTKTTSAIFLAIVLVTGTISLSYPSFMIIGEAQAQQYYGGMDNRYNSYEPDYGMDNDRKSYGMDNDRKSYGNDNGYYKSQYQSSYKPDYKPQYQSYDKKDNRDKSKDSSKSVDIKKINCINTNININGNNTGDINLGNKGQVAAEGYSSAYSSGGSGEGYYDGNYKKDKGITCIINNNNNNTNIVTGGGGNVTDGNGNVTDTCEECFADISVALRTAIEAALAATGPLVIPGTNIQIDASTIAELCIELGLDPLELTRAQIEAAIDAFTTTNPALEAEARALVDCLIDAGVIIIIPPPTCEQCFARLSATVQTAINNILLNSGPIPIPGTVPLVTIPTEVNTIAQLCVYLGANPLNVSQQSLPGLITLFTSLTGGDAAAGQALINCLIEAGIIVVTNTAGLTPFDINTDSNTNDLQITQGTEDSTSTLAKIAKLKQQWLDLLP